MAKAHTGAARWTSEYTEAQKQAIYRAKFIDGHSVRDIQRMARTGQLGVPAFEIGDYAYKLIERGRGAFEATDEDALTRAVAIELKGAELDALATIRAIRQAFKRDGTGKTTALARATRDLALIRKARKDAAINTAPKTKRPAPNQDTPSNAQAKSDATLSNLLDLAGQSGTKDPKGGRESGSVSRPPIDDAEDLAS